MDVFSPQQTDFIKRYFDPQSDTYANALQSALKAGYKQEYAENITTQAKWLQQLMDVSDVTVDEIVKGIKKETLDTESRNRLKAWELLGKYRKMFTDKIEHSVKDDKPIFIIKEKDGTV